MKPYPTLHSNDTYFRSLLRRCSPITSSITPTVNWANICYEAHEVVLSLHYLYIYLTLFLNPAPCWKCDLLISSHAPLEHLYYLHSTERHWVREAEMCFVSKVSGRVWLTELHLWLAMLHWALACLPARVFLSPFYYSSPWEKCRAKDILFYTMLELPLHGFKFRLHFLVAVQSWANNASGFHLILKKMIIVVKCIYHEIYHLKHS